MSKIYNLHIKEFEKNAVSIIADEVSSYLSKNDPKAPYLINKIVRSMDVQTI